MHGTPIIVTIAVSLACSSASSVPPGSNANGSSGAQQNPGASMTIDDVLERASTSDFAAYSPSRLIDAVNALVPLGKAGALAAIDGFLHKRDLAADPHHGLFLVLRVAFDADPHPTVKLGASVPAAPASGLPRFPIVMVGDAPLLVVSRFALRGLAEPVTAHVEYYRQHGTLRAAPLAPASAADRMSEFDKQYTAAYGAPPTPAVHEFVKTQLSRMAS